MQKYVYYISRNCGVLLELTDTLIVGFYCHVIRCRIAQRGVRRGAAEASSSRGVQCMRAWYGLMNLW